MKGSSNDMGKVSDSAYTNTYVSRSQRSSGSSLSRNTNRSESSGYGCGNPSAGDSSNYALPKPISEHKEHKKKKSKAATATSLGKIETKFGSQNNFRQQNEVRTYDSNESSSDLTSNCKKTEIAGVGFVDVTGLGAHNGVSNFTESEGGIGTITNPLGDTTSNINAEFCAVISMKKGCIVNVTPSVKTALGYSRESWIDRSFIEFVHPKDKQTFADCLTKNISLPYGDHDKGVSGRRTSMFCSLRKNGDELSTMECPSDGSNSPKAIANLYVPFHLTTSIKFFRERTRDEKSPMMFLIVNAEPIIPVYKAPEEMILSAIFSTRHDRSCILTNVDINVVQYFGYTPQDMIGRSLFDFYHPEDLPFLKDVYETVVKMKGTPFRSKPYRFAAQNGDFVLLETEWTSFFNPWTEKLEFVVGHHRVLRGPANPNVFQTPGESQRSLLVNISEEIFKESKIIQSEIRALLDEKIQRTEDNDECEITSRSKDLDMFVENLLRDVEPPTTVSKERFRTNDRSFLEHGSAILGAISPHHEYYDSKSSTETPPSYKQLNYNEKLTRFFDSKLLVTNAYGSDEDNINSSMLSNEDAGKNGSNLTGTKEMTLSAENLSSGSNNRTSYDSRDDSENARSANTMPAKNLEILTLTESVLNKHNQDMEKLLVQQHKERRCNIKNGIKQNKDARLNGEKDKSNKQNKDQTKNRGVKRPSINGREGEHCKVSKYDENARTCGAASVPAEVTSTPIDVDDDELLPDEAPPIKNTNIWPSLTDTVQPKQTTHPHLCMAATSNSLMQQDLSRCPVGFLPMVPIYYVPLSQIRNDFMPSVVPSITSQPQQNTFAPLTGVIYPPAVCAPAPVETGYGQFVIPRLVPIHHETSQLINSGNGGQPDNLADGINQPASQATSIKAEPGSTKAPSESSKKLLPSGEHILSCVSVDGGCSTFVPNTKRETDTTSLFDSSLEDSSDSSFYGSFVTTSNLSSCNRETTTAELPRQKSPSKLTTADASTKNHKKPRDMLQKGPPWQEGVKMTEELIYQYQLTPKPLNELLEADMKVLKTFNQPQMVNDQLAQLYSDMQVDAAGFAAKLARRQREAPMDSESCSSSDNARNVMAETKTRSQPQWMRCWPQMPRG